MHPNENYNSTTARLAASAFFITLMTVACGPNQGDGNGWEDGESGSGTDGGDTPIPGDEIRCVELVPGQVSCWVGWELAWARVMLPCQVASGVEGLAWTEGYDDVISPWGAVVCHDILAGDQRLCLYGESSVLLTETTSGWVPEVSALAGTLPIADPPCGLCGDAGQPSCEGSTSNVWAEIRCVDQGNTTGCLGRPTGSVDVWVWITPECALDELDMIALDTWSAASCASGLTPDNFFPEFRCGLPSGQSDSVCWSGGDGWFTQSSPLCDLNIGDQSSWPDWQCDGAAGSITAHPWDAVVCSVGAATACFAIDGESAELALPTCWLDQYPATDMPTCT